MPKFGTHGRSSCRLLLAIVLAGGVIASLGNAADEPASGVAGLVATLKGHTEAIYAVAFSPDGKNLATGSFDKTIKLWETGSGKEIKTLSGPQGHQNLVLSVAFSPDGQTLASGSQDNTAKIWDVPNSSPSKDFAAAAAVNAVAVTVDGKTLAAGGKDNSIHVWTTIDGKEHGIWNGHTGPVTALAFGTNGQLLASSSADNTIRLWNGATGQPMGVIGAHAGAVNSVVMHPNNALAYSVGEDGTLKFWQLPVMPPRSLPAHEAAVNAIALSLDGGQLVSGSADKTVRICNSNNGQPIRLLKGAEAAVTAVAGSGNLVAAGTANNKVILWNAADGKVLGQSTAHNGSVTAVAFNPQGGQLLTAGADGLIKFWALPPIPERIIPHLGAVLAASAMPNGRRLATACADQVVRTWIVDQQIKPERQFPGHTAPVSAVTLTPDGQNLASGGADGSIRIWDQQSGKAKVVFGAHGAALTSLVFNPGGNGDLLSASADGTVKMWRIPKAPPVDFVHPATVTGAAVSPNGLKLVTASADKQVRVWNVETAKLEQTLVGNGIAITGIAVSGDSAALAACGSDKSITVWNAADGKEIKKLTNLPTAVTTIAFASSNPKALIVAAGMADNSVRLYDVAQGKEIKSFPSPAKGDVPGGITAIVVTARDDEIVAGGADGTIQSWTIADGMSKLKLERGGAVSCLALSKDGRIASGGVDKAVKIWNLSDGKPLATISTPAEVRTISFSPDGARLLVGGGDSLARVYGTDGKFLESFVQDGPVSAVAFHNDGKRVIAGANKSARVLTSSLLWTANHAGPVHQAIFNARGDQVLSASDDKTVRIWSALNGQPVRSIASHEGPVHGIAISADGTKIISAGADKTLKFWPVQAANTETAKEEKPSAVIALPGPAGKVVVSPDGARVAVGCDEKTNNVIHVFDAATGKELMSNTEHSGPVQALQYLADNRTLFSASDDKTARLSDVGVLKVLDGHPGGVAALAVSANGQQLLSGGADKTAKLWNLATNKVVQNYGPLAEPIRSVALSRDSSLLAAGAGNLTKVWSVDGKEKMSLPQPAAVTSVAFSPDQARIVTGAGDNRARVWDLVSGKELQWFGYNGPVQSVLFRDNNTIVAASMDKTASIQTISALRVVPVARGPLRALALTANAANVLTGAGKELGLWNAGNGTKEPRSFVGMEGEARAVAVSANNVLVAIGGADQTVRIFNFADAKELGQFKVAAPVHRLAFSPNNQMLAACCEDKSILVWNVLFNPGQPVPADFGRSVQTFVAGGAITDLAFASDNVHLYSGSTANKAQEWKVAADAPLKNLAHPNLVDVVVFSPTGALLASGCHDGIVRIWDVAKGQLVRQIEAHTKPTPAPVYCLAWTSDGKSVVSGSLDHTLKLWNAVSGSLVREFKGYKEKEFEKGHKDGVFCVDFTPDDKFLASGGSDHSIKIWNVADGAVVRECINPNLKMAAATLPTSPQAHPGWVYSLHYSRDGKYLVSAGNAARNQGYLAVWNAADSKLLYGEEVPLGACYSLAVAPDGKLLALGCGPRGRQLQETNAYLLKMPLAEK